MTPRLVLSQIKKSFGPLQVLHGVTLTVGAGEVHGLLGENGAGKSTLLNILSGVFRADAGRVEIDGQSRTITSPRDATEAGIAMIHQELQQVPELTVAQNMFLGASLRHTGGVFINRAAQEAEVRGLILRTLGLGGLHIAQIELGGGEGGDQENTGFEHASLPGV